MNRFISFGAGVQSTALYLLCVFHPEKVISAMGYIPDAAIFADTGAEPSEIYTHIKNLQALGKMPIYLTSKEGLSMEQLMISKSGTRFLPIPAFTLGPNGEKGMLRRQCTNEFKIQPLQRKMRELAGFKKYQRIPSGHIHTWLGISTDEAGRAKESPQHWVKNVYPLLEMNLSREDCIEIINSHGYPAVKSRCYFCPYIGDWEDFRNKHPEEFQKAVEMDLVIRDSSKAGAVRPCFISSKRIPLSEVVGSGSTDLWVDQGFEDECDGLCNT